MLDAEVFPHIAFITRDASARGRRVDGRAREGIANFGLAVFPPFGGMAWNIVPK